MVVRSRNLYVTYNKLVENGVPVGKPYRNLIVYTTSIKNAEHKGKADVADYNKRMKREAVIFVKAARANKTQTRAYNSWRNYLIKKGRINKKVR